MSKKSLPPFEESLKQLESLVSRLESGNLSLDDSLTTYQDGVALIRHCHSLLNAAEHKIEIWRGTDADGQPITAPADPKDFRTKSEHEA
ncbi:MAG: exodeoxyribonuclease VII small subunit [Thermoguttaceae bacterium]